MFLTAHSSVAIFLGLQITNPFLAFLYGMISHFVFDIIPHGDRGIVKKTFNKNRDLEEVRDPGERRKFMLIVVADVVLMFFMLFFLQQKFSISQPSVLSAVFGAVVPDVLQGITAFTRFRWLDAYTKLHHRIHYIVPRDVSLPVGLVIQVTTMVVFLWLAANV